MASAIAQRRYHETSSAYVLPNELRSPFLSLMLPATHMANSAVL